MIWKQIEKFLDALPNNLHVVFNLENDYVEVTTDGSSADANLSIDKFQNLWSEVLRTVCPSSDFFSYLRKLLCDLQDDEVSKISSQLTDGLSETLCNETKLKVEIAESLSKLLLEIIETRKNSDERPRNLSETHVIMNRHRLRIHVQIPKLNTQPSTSDVARAHVKDQIEQLQEEISQLMIKSLPIFHRNDNFNLEAFSAKICEPAIEQFSETLFDDLVNDSQALVALAIVLKCYPGSWRSLFFWDAWLAIIMQLCLSAGKIVFPCMWMSQVFDAERLVNPEHVRYLLFGKDPVSKTHTYALSKLCKATGIAFHAIGDDNPSITGMKAHYGLDCGGNNPKQYCKDGLLMVNLIRCIGKNDSSLNKNSCRNAWIAYTLKLISHFSYANKPVIVLTKSVTPLTAIYIPVVCDTCLVRAPHPSMKPEDIKPDDQPNIDKVRQYLYIYNKPN